MNNKDFSILLEKRTMKFAINIVKVSSAMPNSCESQVIRKQLTKSGTSIGANYHEANRSRSRADFKNRINICLSESNETVYWLKIIKALSLSKQNSLQPILLEANELLALFTSISTKLKQKQL